MEAQPGLRIANRFEILRPLGDGGMGCVWLALDLERLEKVALKVVTAELANDDEVLERFRCEARIGASFEHPNIVRVLEDGVFPGGRPYLVMEYVAGEDLGARISRFGRLPLFETRAIVLQMCAALGTMHARGTLHRDIKPSNILVCETADTLAVKVADLGLARQKGVTPITQVNSIVGTPAYMSPERLSGSHAEPRSDLWSVAAVAYHCLAGQRPFEGGSFGAICISIGLGSIRPVTSVRPGLPAALDAWFARALHATASNRFSSADEVGATFLRACEGAMPPPTLGDRVRRALAFFSGTADELAQTVLARR